jgi:hypothetical protein
MTAGELNDFAGTPIRPLTRDELNRVRARRAELFRRWSAVKPGESLELEWPADDQALTEVR